MDKKESNGCFGLLLFVISIVVIVFLTEILSTWAIYGCNPINYITSTPAPGWTIEKNQYGEYRCAIVRKDGLVMDSFGTKKSLTGAIVSSWNWHNYYKEQSRLEDSEWETIKK